MKCEDLRDSFVSGGSKRKYSGKPGSSQCYCHIIDRVLWIHRMLVTKRDLLFPQLLRLPSRLLGLVLPLHLCFSSHLVRLSVPSSKDFWSPNEIYFFLNFFGYPVDFSGWFYHFICVAVVIW